MSKIKLKNEKIKRQYLNFMSGAEGYSDSTILLAEKALWKYEDFTKHSDYASFNDQVAQRFKKWLKNSKNKKTGKILSIRTQYHILRHLNDFFTWLSGQPGYKSKVSQSDVSYLSLSKAESRKARATKQPRYPSLEHIKQLCAFEIRNDIDRRDQALIAFAALSGMRDSAIVSLPIGCFNPQKLQVDQNPQRGVKVKYSKHIISALFSFDQELLGFVLDWYKYLRDELLFKDADPFFPSTEVAHESKSKHSFVAKGVQKDFWQDAGAMRRVFKSRAKQQNLEYFHPHTFRHFVIAETREYASTPKELKAISQNLGHEKISTTLMSYGTIDDYEVPDIVSKIDFSETRKTKDELFRTIEKTMKQLKSAE